jgi:hypothetical protein
MDGPIVLRLITLSNHIPRVGLLEGVVSRVWHRGVAERALSHLWNSESYKKPVLVEGMRGHNPQDYLSKNTEADLKILVRILSIQHYFH